MARFLQNNPDESLVIAAASGDDEAFANLVLRNKSLVFRIAARFAQDDDELEDICQETFIKAYEGLGKFRRDAPFEQWLKRIAINTCHDSLRKRRHEKKRESLESVACKAMDEADAARHEAHQARDMLDWAMGFLKPAERLVITLLELEEMTVKEIVALTGWSESNVKVRAWRARQALKKILEKHHER